MTQNKDWAEQSQEIGRCAMSAIREMVAALECDYDRIAELRDERDSWVSNDDGDGDEQNRTAEEWATEFPSQAEELLGLEDAAGDCESREDAEQRIHDDPLSLQFRSGWCQFKDDMEPEEFELLLTTGGPAVRIIGEICNGEARNPQLQVQDWFQPWTEYVTTSEDDDALLAYCLCFCMEQ